MLRLLTTCALFMPDAALTPYPAYKIVQNQWIAQVA
ncbi:4-phosphopantetheinyl transferase EntD [Escherichia coli]|nr:4-phosphopantetheinyl transferase EntD [Escherichia coli]OKW43962.1 4-phosphopantetheinyl transferase EntD [Escherichia coli]OKW93543.1 4-phosphopantetheinyl transferase EntD [Escherichia coli]TEZ35545.1 4-phosphopantetheinyl transferase EntD [Escherichia coli]